MKAPVLICSVIIILGGSAGNFLRYAEQKPDRPPQFSLIPYQANGFFGEERRFDDFSYDILKADTTTLRLYLDADGIPYWLFVAYFSSQKYGSQIHSPKHCLPGGGWRIDSLDSFNLPIGGAKTVKRAVIGSQHEKHLMIYWFETRSGSVADEFALKFDLVRNSLLLNPTDAAFVRLTVPIEGGDLEAATNRAISYLETFQQPIAASLPFDN
jgi:EpsI family protein